MLAFRDQPIKHKLIWLSVLASGSALILACAAFIAYDRWTFRDAVVQRVSTQAKIVGYNSAAALLFSDPKTATEILTALSAEPDIVSAAIYGVDGKIFASYTRGGETSTAETLPSEFLPAQANGHRFERKYLELWWRIVLDQEPIGRVVIRASLNTFEVHLLRYIGIAIVVLLVSTIASILVSAWFQRRISEPLLGLVATAETVSRDKDYSVRATPHSRDEIGLLVETFNEMLSRIQEQNADLQKVHGELEQRVIERTSQLEAANKELEAFSYSVSHDLRAPLRGIDGFSQALLEDYSGQLDAQGKEYLERVRAGTQRMAQLIDDMLNLSRVTRGEMRRETVDLSDLALKIAAELQKTDPERKVDFVIAKRLSATGDARLLRIVLENLLTNAWKFTGKNPQAFIQIGVSQNNGPPVYFVRDDGAGFDMAYADKLFGVFQRLHGATDFKGTGIGLATVQRIIHRHGGRVWAEGKVGQGATFYFTL